MLANAQTLQRRYLGQLRTCQMQLLKQLRRLSRQVSDVFHVGCESRRANHFRYVTAVQTKGSWCVPT